MTAPSCEYCESSRRELVFDYTAPPPGETRFPSLENKNYHRQIFRCETCGHFTSECGMDISGLYDEEYVNATYKDDDGVRQTFERIIRLPSEKSDNAGRVERVCAFADSYFPAGTERRLLDIGAGLAVFPWGMKQRGWDCTALDPDPRAADHARNVAGVKSICADFLRNAPTERYPLVTLNKVLEHVPDPVDMLRRAGGLLAEPGVLYIEVPDGEVACSEGAGREEFFLEHFQIFSAASLALLARHAGLKVLALQRLREPSTKFTLCCFAMRT